MFRPDLTITFQNGLVMDAGVTAHSLRIARGKIVAWDEPPHQNDLVVDLQGGLIMPGLINAHDHLALNHFPRLKYRERYTNAREWFADVEARFESDPQITEPRAKPIADRFFMGALKNLLSGVTTVCHHDPLPRGIEKNVPLRLVRRFGFCHSLARGGDVAHSYTRTPRAAPWIIHLAEGTDEASAHECDELAALGCLRANTVLVHGIGLTPAQRREMIACDAALIWCPSSNFFLFGQTARVRELFDSGRAALGTDSRLSGAGDIWDELRAAHSTGQLSPRELFRLVTDLPARVLRLAQGGSLQRGAPADLVVLPPHPDPFASLIEMKRSAVQLVMIGGEPLYGDTKFANVFLRARVATESVCVDGREKLLAGKIARRLAHSTIQETGVKRCD